MRLSALLPALLPGLLACSTTSQNPIVLGDGGAEGGVGGTGGRAGSSGTGGSAGAGADGGAAGTTTGGSGGGGGDLADFGDSFDGAELDAKWQVFNASDIERLEVVGSHMVLEPRESIWWHMETGPLVYQLVSGNFRMSATVRVSTVNGSAQPTQPTHWGGIMLRAPGTGPQNYVDIVLGRDAADDALLSIERNTTTNGVSTWLAVDWADGGEAELRICRVDAAFSVYTRSVGTTTWSLQETYQRPDLPDPIQAGMIGHAWFTTTPDLLVRFDDIRFERVSVMGDCDDSAS